MPAAARRTARHRPMTRGAAPLPERSRVPVPPIQPGPLRDKNQPATPTSQITRKLRVPGAAKVRRRQTPRTIVVAQTRWELRERPRLLRARPGTRPNRAAQKLQALAAEKGRK